jgi:hypothetical protein
VRLGKGQISCTVTLVSELSLIAFSFEANLEYFDRIGTEVLSGGRK